jgi:hypothetical protein
MATTFTEKHRLSTILQRVICNNLKEVWLRQLAEAVEKGGAQAGRLTQRLFNGSISPKEIKDLKRILQVRVCRC